MLYTEELRVRGGEKGRENGPEAVEDIWSCLAATSQEALHHYQQKHDDDNKDGSKSGESFLPFVSCTLYI